MVMTSMLLFVQKNQFLPKTWPKIKSSSLITIKSLRKSQFKSKIKQVLFEIFQKTEDYIDVPQILCDIKQMKML